MTKTAVAAGDAWEPDGTGFAEIHDREPDGTGFAEIHDREPDGTGFAEIHDRDTGFAEIHDREPDHTMNRNLSSSQFRSLSAQQRVAAKQDGRRAAELLAKGNKRGAKNLIQRGKEARAGSRYPGDKGGFAKPVDKFKAPVVSPEPNRVLDEQTRRRGVGGAEVGYPRYGPGSNYGYKPDRRR